MPQITVNSANINTFGFKAVFNPYTKSVLFDTSIFTSYKGSSGSGIFACKICFSLKDSAGVELMTVDWNNPQITPSVNQQYTLDLSYLPVVFMFQSYEIIGYIQDGNGNVYSTIPVYKNVCQPVDVTESGYVNGIFQVIPDCVNNTLTVKELTVLTYNNSVPFSITKAGTLSYPTGTISAVTFTGTPFTNNAIYTGEYRIVNTTAATYALGDDIYVLITYLTNSVFDVTCTNRIADLLCCVAEVQNVAKKDCNNAKGKHAQQQLLEISTYLLTGLLKEINGQDASIEADFIKKSLNCNCGATSVHQNEMVPINPSIYSIVLNGIGGTTIPSPIVNAGTKTFNIASNAYIVAKKDTGDAAFTITTDTSVANTVKYLIAFDYNVMAGYIITAIANNPSYIATLQNLLVTALDLSGLNGKCVLNTSTSDYTLQYSNVTSTDLVHIIVINGVEYNAPANLHANNAAGVQSWLNSLTLGTFTVTFSLGVISITSLNNPNTLSLFYFIINSIKYTVLFQNSNYTLVQILQAIIDYLCGITALQVALDNTLTIYSFDYNGNIVSSTVTPLQSQNDYNIILQNSISTIVARINTLTGITCAKLAAIFLDNPLLSFTSTSRLYGSENGNCVAWTDQQIALGVIRSIQSYADVKTAFCAIDCSSPATCPDISDISLNMSGANIGVYGLTWAALPTAAQTVTIKYKLNSSSNWIVATNSVTILPNGTISGTTPYLITGVTAGMTYDVQIINNCGGVGFIKQITTPTGTVYSASYLLENMLYLVCGATPITLYSNAPFASGVVLYTDIGLTIPKTGFVYVTTTGYNIFGINSGTGLVGADTGSSCTTGTGNLYKVDTHGESLCAQPSTTYYTNGAFTIGSTVYVDIALTTPLVGYTYILNPVDGIVYNLNSVTGNVISSTGLSCLA